MNMILVYFHCLKGKERDNAILFIDEADSLLSRRLTNVTQGSEQAINSMRSQLLICLERFRGVVIFATNLVENYDKAFETRVRHVHFLLPDEQGRRDIWRRHLPARLPLAPDISLDQPPESRQNRGEARRNWSPLDGGREGECRKADQRSVKVVL